MMKTNMKWSPSYKSMQGTILNFVKKTKLKFMWSLDTNL